MLRKTLFVSLLCLAVLCAVCSAQVSTSSISGTVQDSSGAIVTGATVVATNEATGTSYTATTTSAGTYVFSSVTPGTYTIKVSKGGFKSFSSTKNVLSVGQPLVVNASLSVGASSETVEVQSTYERIETTNATLGNVVTEEQIKNLPLNGRNPLALLTLEPGVVQRTTNGAGSGTHVFGSRDRAHNVTVDGIDANESTVPNPQSNLQRLNPDNVQEFRTVTLGATAENGRNSGANVLVATKGGSNAVHGAVFYFNRNSAYNANEWFNNYNGKKRPDLKLHQYGFDVGGPIIKNKTFFFGSFQNNLIKQTAPINSTNVGVCGAPCVYTASARNGIYRFVRGTVTTSAGKSFNQNSPGMVDASGSLLPGIAVCGSGVTTNCVDSYNMNANDPAGIGQDPKMKAIFNSTPLPNNFLLGDGLNTAGFDWNAPAKFTGPHYMVRVDHTFGPNDNIFVRWLQNRYDTKDGDFLNARPAVFPGFAPLGEVNRIGRNLAVSYRHTFSPNLVNEFTFGFNRFAFLFTFRESNPDYADPTKNPPYADQCVIGSFVNVDAPYCASPHTARAVTTPQFIDNITWTKGAHTFRAGLNFRFYMHNDSRGFFGSSVVTPVVTFNRSNRLGNFNNIPSGSGAAAPNSTDINRLNQMIVEMAGIPRRIQQAFFADFNSDTYVNTEFATVYTRAHQYDTYFMDTWKLRPNLTLNWGLRWEYNPPPFDAKATLVPDKAIDGSQGNVTFVKADGWTQNSNLGSIAPRIGLAWSPDQKTSVRAGYAWLFDTLSTFQVTAMAGKVPGFLQNCNVDISSAGVATATSGCNIPAGTANRINQNFPLAVPAPSVKPSAALFSPPQAQGLAPSVGAFDPNLKNPSVHEWSLSIQRELPKGFVAEVGYVGKRGTHLYRAYDLNQVRTDQTGFLASYNIARTNVLNGCRADGTNCPAGVTGVAPTLLLQLTTAANLNGRTSDFQRNSIGALANFIDQRSGTDYIVNRGFAANYFRPNPQFSQIFYQDSGGNSYYHGAYVSARRHWEQGLDLTFSYTYSKSIDDMSIDPTGAATGGGLSTTNSRTPTDIRNFRLDRALSDFDNRHVIQTNMLAELPFGQKKWLFSNAPNWVNQIIGGWSLTGIFNYQSGEPYSLTSGAFTTNGAHVSFAEVRGPKDTGNLHFVNGVAGPVFYETGSLITNPADPNFNCKNVTGTTTYFCIPLAGSNGGGRNTVQGPNFWNLDSGLLKNFTVTERFKLQFRAEFFNVLNHANWENPRNSTTGSPSIQSTAFGQTCCVSASQPSSATVIAIGEPNRTMQLGLKLTF